MTIEPKQPSTIEEGLKKGRQKKGGKRGRRREADEREEEKKKYIVCTKWIIEELPLLKRSDFP